MTVWPPPFRFAISTTPRPRAVTSSATSATVPAASPSTAAIAPSPAGTAACMRSPRRRVSRSASAKERAPSATSAEYSPRLWPAAISQLPRAAATARNAATLTVSRAGWVFRVSRSASAGPSKQRAERDSPSTSSASSKTARDSGKVAARGPGPSPALGTLAGEEEGGRAHPWQPVDKAGRAPRPARRPADKTRIGRPTGRIPTDSRRRAKRSAGMSSPIDCRPVLSTGC